MSAPDTRQRVEALCAFENRRAGTDAERRATNALRDDLEEAGARVAIEPTYVHPQWPAVHFVHCLIAIAGSLVAGASAPVGFALVLVAAISFYLDLAGRWYVLRALLFFRRASQNLVSPPIPREAEPRDRVIICAHLDAPYTGAAYNSWALRAFAGFQRIWPARTSPQAVVFWAMVLLLPPLGARMAGIDADWIPALQLPQTFVLLIAAFFYGEIALSPISPGANGNASGVAAALRTVDRLRAEPPEALEVILLLPGAGETTRQGVRSFIRAHRKELEKERTWFIDIDSAGRGEPRWVELEVPVIAQPPGPELAALAAALSEGVADREPLPLAPASSASTAGAYGYPAIALTARQTDGFVPAGHHRHDDTPGNVDPESVGAVADFAVDLVRLLDRDVARRRRSG